MIKPGWVHLLAKECGKHSHKIRRTIAMNPLCISRKVKIELPAGQAMRSEGVIALFLLVNDIIKGSSIGDDLGASSVIIANAE